MVRVYGWYEAIDLPAEELSERNLHLPYWALAVATSLIPMLWLILYARRCARARRRSAGICLSCGYDLRATPGRCPECGAVPAEAKA